MSFSSWEVVTFTMGMGMEGAAVASVISQALSCLWVVHFLRGSRTLTALSMKRACLSLRCALEIMRLGVAGCVMQATNALVLVAATSTLRSVGSDVYIGILTILSSVRDVVVVPIHGLTGAAQAVIGFNFGAGKLKRVLTGVFFLTPVSTGYMILAWGLIFLFPGAVLGLFSADPQILEQGIPACHVYFFGFFMMAFHMTGQNVFVALGRYRQAIFFSLLRKAFVVVPLTLILPRVTDLGVRGVFLAEPISNFVSGVLCYASMALTLHYLVRKRQR